MITRNRILCVLGIWIVLIPLSGFPAAYKSFFVILSGLAVVVLAFLYARSKRVGQIHYESIQPEAAAEVYTQNQPTPPPVYTHANPVQHTGEEDRFTDIRMIRSRSRPVKTF